MFMDGLNSTMLIGRLQRSMIYHLIGVVHLAEIYHCNVLQKTWSGGSTYTKYVTVTFEKIYTSTIYELTMSRRRQG
jgi:hypothetical protein